MLNIYETHFMLQAIQGYNEPFTFLRDTFFPNVETFMTEKALVDVVKGGKTMAPLVAPYVNGSLDKRSGYQTREITTPRVAPFRTLTGDDIKKRTPGESLISGKSAQQRAQEILAKDLVDLDKKIIYTEEYMAAKVLLGASVDIDEVDESGNVAGKFNIDYGFTNLVEVKKTEKWNLRQPSVEDSTKEASTVNPIKVIEKWIDEYVIQNSSNTPDIVVLDPDAAEAFSNNTYVDKILQRRAQAGTVQEPTYKGKGATFIGRFTKYNLEFYAYSNLVDQGSGKPTQLLPSGTVIIGPSGQGKMNYGAVNQLEEGKGWLTYEERRVPLYTVDQKAQVETLKVTSRPLPSPHDVDSFVVASGVC